MIITEAYAEGMRRRDFEQQREILERYKGSLKNKTIKKSRKRFILNTVNDIIQLFHDRIINVNTLPDKIEITILGFSQINNKDHLMPIVYIIHKKKCIVTMGIVKVALTIHTINRIIQTEKVNYKFIGKLILPIMCQAEQIKSKHTGDVKLYMDIGVVYTSITDDMIFIHTFIKADKLMNWKKEKYEQMDFSKQSIYI